MISSRQKYENLQNIKMRYLCYDNDYNGKSFDISLRYPEYLVSLSTYKFKISNICQCVNLRNLHSYLNIYNSDDIVSLKSWAGFIVGKINTIKTVTASSRNYSGTTSSSTCILVKDILIQTSSTPSSFVKTQRILGTYMFIMMKEFTT